MANKKKNGSAKRARRSKAESSTGAKEAHAEMRTASDAQTEMDMPKPDDILFHMKNIKSWKEKATTINSGVRNARKSAAQVSKLLPAIIDELLALERLADQSEFKRRMEMLGAGLKAIGSPYQINIFDTLAGDVQSQAHKRGANDGAAGRSANCPYPDGSDMAAQYMAGWSEEQAKILGVDLSHDDRPAGEGHNSEDADGDEDGEFAGTDEAERREDHAHVN